MTTRQPTKNVVRASEATASRKKPGPTRQLSSQEQSELIDNMGDDEPVATSSDDDVEIEVVVDVDAPPTRPPQ